MYEHKTNMADYSDLLCTLKCHEKAISCVGNSSWVSWGHLDMRVL